MLRAAVGEHPTNSVFVLLDILKLTAGLGTSLLQMISRSLLVFTLKEEVIGMSCESITSRICQIVNPVIDILGLFGLALAIGRQWVWGCDLAILIGKFRFPRKFHDAPPPWLWRKKVLALTWFVPWPVHDRCRTSGSSTIHRHAPGQ